jgi:hypothetical protein
MIHDVSGMVLGEVGRKWCYGKVRRLTDIVVAMDFCGRVAV